MNALVVRILVVDDEPPIRRLLRNGLGRQGFDVLDAATGRAALEALVNNPDLMILDLGLPDIEGFDVLRIMREGGDTKPVIILSCREDEETIVKALDLGAHDYVTKPFGMKELLARINAALRHDLQARGERPVFVVDNLSIDLVRRTVRVGGSQVVFVAKEYELLRLLVKHAGKVLERAFILREIWGPNTKPNLLRIYIGQLRQKIEPDPEHPRYIMTIVGVGYRLRSPD